MSLQTDSYLGFSYNGKTLNMKPGADFTGFIENSGNDLQFFNTPDFTNEFVNTQFGEKTFYTGNTKTNRRLEFDIQLDKITLEKYKEFLEWLNLDDTGFLVLDYNSNYGFEVKIDSISNSEFHVTREDNCDDKYYVNLTISFITITDFAAIWKQTYEEDVFWSDGEEDILIDNSKGQVFIEAETGDIFKIFNRHNLKNYIVIEFDGNLKIETVGSGSSVLVDFEGAGAGAKYFSEFGIALKADGSFIACGLNPSITCDPVIAWAPNTNKELKITGTINKIIPTSREIL